MVVALAAACGDDPAVQNSGAGGAGDTGAGGGGGDISFGDAKPTDAAGKSDAGADSGSADTGSVDTGAGDSGSVDTGAEDTGHSDTAAGDTGGVDTGAGDTGGVDTGGGDAGTTDTGAGDAGTTDTGAGDDSASIDAGGDGGGAAGSCAGKCGKYDGSAACQCDSSCTQYGDCCADFGAVCGCIGDDCCKADADCDDSVACTDDSCGAEGKCEHKAKAGTCAVEKTCYIKGESPKDNACLICDPDQDAGALSAKKGTSCDDGSACTSADTCNELGQCVGTPKANCCKVDADCTSDKPCQTGTCDAVAGTCSFSDVAGCCTTGVCCDAVQKTTKAAGASCGITAKATEYQCDGNAAQKRQAYDGCDGKSASTCSSDAQYLAWTPWATISTCVAGQGCVLTSKNDPPVCKAQGGGCTDAASCDDNNPCTVDACDKGACTNAPKAGCCVFDSECDDGNACTVDSCGADNSCGHTPKTCKAGSDCEVSTCDSQTGACVASVKPDSCKIDGLCYASGAKDNDDGCQVCTPSASTTSWSLTSTCSCTSGVCCDEKAGKIKPQATQCDDAVKASEYKCADDGKAMLERQAYRGCTGKSNTCSTSKTNYAWTDWQEVQKCATGTVCEVSDPAVKGSCVKTGGGTACTPNTTCCTSSGTIAAKGTTCGKTTVKTETQCTDNKPGGKVQERSAVAGCTGSSTTCSSASSNLVWTAWADKTTCKSDEACSVTDGTASCKKVGVCDPKLACCTSSGTLAAKNSKCGTTSLATEYQCSGTSKGAKVQQRDAYGGCSGSGTGCSYTDANLHWTDWKDIKTCASNEYCSVGDDGKPGCVNPPTLACTKKDAWEGGEDATTAKKIGDFKDSDPALILTPKPIMGGANIAAGSADKDYFFYSITDAANTTNPRVHIEWSAPGAVTVCAYYACDKGSNGTDCDPVVCPADATPYKYPMVSGADPNGCCRVAQKGELDFSVNAAGTTNETGKVHFNIKNQSPFCQEVDVKLAFGSNTNTVCDPTKTCCAPSGQWASKGTQCSDKPTKTEYKCAGTKAGDDVLVRNAYAGCTGGSGTCSVAASNLVWSDWTVATNCKTSEICSVPDPTKAGTCVANNELVCKAPDKYEGPTKTSESYDLGSFKDGQDAVMVSPAIHLGGSDDKDWFKYRIADDPNLNDPEVHIEWQAADAVTVCAYYQCTKGTNNTDCYPVDCPVGSTAYVNSAVSDAAPNGCCMTGTKGTLEFYPDAPGIFNTDETGWVFFNVKNAAPICQYVLTKLAFDGSTTACGDGQVDSGEANSCPVDGGSCSGKCGAAYDASKPCQCDSACAGIGDCCWDKPLVCGG